METKRDLLEKAKDLPLMTATQREELERRLAEHLANPDELVSWDEVKASIAKGWQSR